MTLSQQVDKLLEKRPTLRMEWTAKSHEAHGMNPEDASTRACVEEQLNASQEYQQ